MRRSGPPSEFPFLLAMLAFALLAGCTAPPPAPNPILGYCPQWVQGPGHAALSVDAVGGTPVAQDLAPTGTDGTPFWTSAGHPFDMVRLHVVSGTVPDGATLVARAFTDNGTTQRNWRTYSPDAATWLPSLQFTGAVASKDFEAYLSSVDHDDMPSAQPIHVAWTLEGGAAGTNGTAHLSYEATFWYKVCGIP